MQFYLKIIVYNLKNLNWRGSLNCEITHWLLFLLKNETEEKTNEKNWLSFKA